MMEVKNMKGKKFKSQKGQSFVEYALILVAVLVFGALLIILLQRFGPRIAEAVSCTINFAAGATTYSTTRLPGQQQTITTLNGCLGLIQGTNLGS